MRAIYIGCGADDVRQKAYPSAPGEFRFVGADRWTPCEPPAPGHTGYLLFGCIRQGGTCGAVLVGNGFKPEGRATWMWNGSLDAPTLTPSVNCLSHGPGGEKYAGCGWHNFLTDGEWGRG